MKRAIPGSLSLLALLLAPTPCGATIHYSVSVADREQHLFHVIMTVPNVQHELVVQMPAWNALYQIRDFAHQLINVSARTAAKPATSSTSAGAPNGMPNTQSEALNVAKRDKQTWTILADGTIVLDYGVHWDEPGPFSSQLNAHHAFINLAEILLYLPARRSEDVEVAFTDLAPGWKIAVELPATQAANSFHAANYDALVDAPVEIGLFDEFRVEVNGARIRVVVDAEKWDRAQLERIVRAIVEYETTLMREVPFIEYLFLYHFGIRGGGMEHANSTAIAAHDVTDAENTTAHEFCHLWNVKRIRPRSLEPVDYTQEQHTRSLWFAEGVTSTYAAYALERSALWTRKEFYQDLAWQIGELESRPARRWKSVEESSLDAWLEKYPFYHRPGVSISYYNKGQIVGFLLDVVVRDASDNHASLDDVMRYLNQNFAHRGSFYNDTTDIRAAAEHFAGRSLAEFFNRYISGTDEIPYDDLLRPAGLTLRPQAGRWLVLGFETGAGPGGPGTVVKVDRGSAPESVGLREGDVVLELDGQPFPRRPERWLRDRPLGEVVHLRVSRNGGELNFSFPLEAREHTVFEIVEQEQPTDKQRRIREGLLHGTTDP